MISRPGKELSFKDLHGGEFFFYYPKGVRTHAVRLKENTHRHEAVLIENGTIVWIDDSEKVIGVKHPLDLTLP